MIRKHPLAVHCSLQGYDGSLSGLCTGLLAAVCSCIHCGHVSGCTSKPHDLQSSYKVFTKHLPGIYKVIFGYILVHSKQAFDMEREGLGEADLRTLDDLRSARANVGKEILKVPHPTRKQVKLLPCNHDFHIFLAPPNYNPRCPTLNPNGD